MTASTSLQTVSARLATFKGAHPTTTKGRTSNAKSTKSTTWPHEKLSPVELAHAGFYFTPTPVSPDNTTCFLCERSLDGWEEEDDPFVEHLRHSSECGWAVTMNIVRQSSNPATIEDPASPTIEEARRATFISWPHEEKRGWACKIEKLVQTGWYFCPNDESDDLVSCPYCKLSLDGWEPTDDPFDEHYRRSSDCSFFLFANAPRKRTTRNKVGRPSKNSRLSTQSTNTALSDAPTMDLDETMDNSMLSQVSKSSKTSKKGTKTKKTRASKSKKADALEANSQYEPAQIYDEEALKGNGRKRKSDAISEAAGEDNYRSQDLPSPELPSKKRATGTRTKNATQKKTSTANDPTDTATDDELAMNTERPSKGAGKKKRSTSKTRKPQKPSIASAASTASLRSQIPDDSEIDAALEADLEREESDGPDNKEEAGAPSTASVAPIRRKDKRSRNDANFDNEPEEVPKKTTRKKNPVKKKETKKNTSDVSKKVDINPDENLTHAPSDVDMDDPIAKLPSNEKLPADDDDSQLQGTQTKPTATKPKKSKKKADSSGPKPKPKSHDITSSQTSTAATNATSRNEMKLQESYDNEFGSSLSENDGSAPNEPAKTDPQENGLASQKGGHKNTNSRHEASTRHDIPSRIPPSPMNPPRQQQNCTPSPSPQSSDAENRPPSSKPSTNPPSQPQITSVPLAASTPISSPSKRAAQSDNVMTDYPWDPVDLEDAFQFDPSDKENVNLEDILHEAKGELTTPEKNMSVEEWIALNAKKGEQKLRSECERVVNIFEREGGRAMRSLEGIQCTD